MILRSCVHLVKINANFTIFGTFSVCMGLGQPAILAHIQTFTIIQHIQKFFSNLIRFNILDIPKEIINWAPGLF